MELLRGDYPSTYIAEELKIPILIWAPREPAFDGGRIMANALVSATMNSAALKRLQYPYHFIYGNYDEPRVQKEVANYIKIYRVIKQLRKTHLALIGYRPTGFYSSTFDEALIHKTLGAKIEEFDLVFLFNKAEEIDDSRVKADMEYLKKLLHSRTFRRDIWKTTTKIYFPSFLIICRCINNDSIKMIYSSL